MVDEIDYIPQGGDRQIDSSSKTSSDGGGYNFVFYDSIPYKKKKKKKREIGEPVDIQLSSVPKSTHKKTSTPVPPERGNDEEDSSTKDSTGHINLKA